MSNTSIQAINFSSMSPHKLYFLYGKKPETSEAVKEYLNSIVHYTTEWDQGHVDTRKGVYEMMPNIEKLTLSVYGFVNQDFYLRPSIKSIHMNFELSFEENRKNGLVDILYRNAFLDWFNILEKYIVEHPDSQLEELHIGFMPEVKLFLSIKNHYIVDYDEYGPIYEDDDWFVETSKHNPSEYFFALSQDSEKSVKKIGTALLKLLSLRQWKAISLPYHFPSAAVVAELYPFATFTDEIKEEGTKERVVASLEEFREEHREELRKRNKK